MTGGSSASSRWAISPWIPVIRGDRARPLRRSPDRSVPEKSPRESHRAIGPRRARANSSHRARTKDQRTMKAIAFHGVGDIRLENVSDPKIQEPTDAVVRLTASAICGTDLHFVRGTVPGMVPGTILGHEGVGIVEEVGADVRNVQPGDRV